MLLGSVVYPLNIHVHKYAQRPSPSNTQGKKAQKNKRRNKFLLAKIYSYRECSYSYTN